jgi:hypothetical protein
LNLQSPSNEDNQSAAMYIRRLEKETGFVDRDKAGGVKATASSLESLSGLVPVPMVSEFLEVAIRALKACRVCVLI